MPQGCNVAPHLSLTLFSQTWSLLPDCWSTDGWKRVLCYQLKLRNFCQCSFTTLYSLALNTDNPLQWEFYYSIHITIGDAIWFGCLTISIIVLYPKLLSLSHHNFTEQETSVAIHSVMNSHAEAWTTTWAQDCISHVSVANPSHSLVPRPVRNPLRAREQG